jgi:hypothetical protein
MLLPHPLQDRLARFYGSKLAQVAEVVKAKVYDGDKY